MVYLSFQPVFHKGRGMCNPGCWMMHIKGPLLLIGKSSPCGGSRFHLSLSKWFENMLFTAITIVLLSFFHGMVVLVGI